MITVRGVNLYPSNVEHLLLSVPDVAPHYQLVVDRLGAMDEVTVHCEPLSAEVDTEVLQTTVETVLREHTGIRITVELLEPGAIPRSEGKAVRVVDRRRR
jgi:phenylacetate-CoA ligase